MKLCCSVPAGSRSWITTTERSKMFDVSLVVLMIPDSIFALLTACKSIHSMTMSSPDKQNHPNLRSQPFESVQSSHPGVPQPATRWHRHAQMRNYLASPAAGPSRSARSPALATSPALLTLVSTSCHMLCRVNTVASESYMSFPLELRRLTSSSKCARPLAEVVPLPKASSELFDYLGLASHPAPGRRQTPSLAWIQSCLDGHAVLTYVNFCTSRVSCCCRPTLVRQRNHSISFAEWRLSLRS